MTETRRSAAIRACLDGSPPSRRRCAPRLGASRSLLRAEGIVGECGANRLQNDLLRAPIRLRGDVAGASGLPGNAHTRQQITTGGVRPLPGRSNSRSYMLCILVAVPHAAGQARQARRLARLFLRTGAGRPKTPRCPGWQLVNCRLLQMLYSRWSPADLDARRRRHAAAYTTNTWSHARIVDNRRGKNTTVRFAVFAACVRPINALGGVSSVQARPDGSSDDEEGRIAQDGRGQAMRNASPGLSAWPFSRSLRSLRQLEDELWAWAILAA